MTTISKKLGLGKLAYQVWHRPKAALDRCIGDGGPWQQWLTYQAEKEMVAAAGQLPPLPPPAPEDPEIGYLTGKRYWHQTAFCAWSLSRAAGRPFRFLFHDDGSLTPAFCEDARRIFPGCEIMRETEARAWLDRCLPEERFPSLRGQRISYPHIRKLTDFHAGKTGWRVVMDSDILFFRRPDALFSWLQAPTQPLHATDIQDSYGYPLEALNALADAPVPHAVNVGILGLPSHELDWDRIEHWCSHLLANHGSSYYLEQALAALIVTSRPAQRLALQDYLLMPNEQECRRPTTVMHHYVGQPKHGYFRHAWRNVLKEQ